MGGDMMITGSLVGDTHIGELRRPKLFGQPSRKFKTGKEQKLLHKDCCPKLDVKN